MKEISISCEDSLKKKYPTPFKKALFWPENSEMSTKKVKKNVKIQPTVANAKEYVDQQRRLDEIKKLKEELKRIREDKKQRLQEEKRLKSERKTQSCDKRLHKQNCDKQLTKEKDCDKLLSKEKSDEDHEKENMGEVMSVGVYVIVMYEGELFPGYIKEIETDGVIVKAMTTSGPNWKWPEKEDILKYTRDEVICVIKPPVLINKRGTYCVPEIEKLKPSITY